MKANEWIATCRGTSERFNKVWVTWSHYILGSDTVPSSLDAPLLTLAESGFVTLVGDSYF